MTEQMQRQTGFDALLERPLLTSIWNRRTHRVSRGSSVEAGSLSWASDEPRTPLTELEEAVLISLTSRRFAYGPCFGVRPARRYAHKA